MAELIALTRFCLAGNRRLLFWMLVIVGLGQLNLFAWGVFNPALLQPTILPLTLVCVMFPTVLLSIVVFDYGGSGNLVAAGSGCSHWVLRMPIHSWKIAVVPILLRSAWVSGLWMMLALNLWVMEPHRPLPWLGPCAALSAASVFLLVVGWQPFTVAFLRIPALAIGAVAIFACFVSILSAAGVDGQPWPRGWTFLVSVLGIVIYGSTVALAMRAIATARLNATGIVPELRAAAPRKIVHALTQRDWLITRSGPFTGPLRALIWHEVLLIEKAATYMLIFCVVPASIFWIAIVPLNAVAFWIVNAMFCYAAIFAINGSHATPMARGVSTIPTLLSASPLSNATIAWTRWLVPVAVASAIYLCVATVLVGWFLWPSNRVQWLQWAEAQRSWCDASGSSVSIGLRLQLAAWLAFFIFAISRLSSYWWIGQTGRQWFVVVTSSIAIALYLVPFSLGLAWFMRQTDWQDVQTMGHLLLRQASTAIGVAMVLKIIAVALVAMQVYRKRLVDASTLATVLAIWLGVVATVSVGLWLLIPSSQITFAAVTSVTVITIPLARMLAMPWAVAWNRHR